MERCQGGLRSSSSDDEIGPHLTDEMQKFAHCAQSKTVENFRKIAAPGAAGPRISQWHPSPAAIVMVMAVESANSRVRRHRL